MIKISAIVLLAATMAGCSTLSSEVGTAGVVRTEGGLVSGTGTATGISTYRGIPFAAAPVGALRWRAPQPAAPWAGVKPGDKFGADCMQPAEYPELRGAGMSEDCLNLNVWSPAQRASAKLPVMVWIYGGGYTYGSGSHPSYDGEALARRGVVVVTLNYRIGLLGFMAHPQLTAESPTHSSGNYGVLDQIAALQWVQRNIAAFGGDPARVTVFGQSAGAAAISTLLVSPLSDGLFQQAIMQSVGVMRPMASLSQAEAYGASFDPSIQTLRNASATELVERLRKAPAVQFGMTQARPLSIVADGHVIRQPDYRAFKNGEFKKVPILVGNNLDEGGGATRSIPVKTSQQLTDYLARNFPGMEQRASSVYGTSQDAGVAQALSNLYSDTQFNFGTREMLKAQSRHGVPAYRYVFSRHRNTAQAAPIHGDELQFAFDNLRAPHRGRQRPFDAHDEKVARAMADAWVRFAKTGSPAGGDLPAWLAYDSVTEPFMDFGATLSAGAGYATPGLDLVRDYYARQRQP
jgi:carboxylesterase type B